MRPAPAGEIASIPGRFGWAAGLVFAASSPSFAAHAGCGKRLAARIDPLVVADQAIRDASIALPSEARPGTEFMRRWQRTHARSTAFAKPTIAECGWPKNSAIGRDGGQNSILFVQHADRDPAFQRHALYRLAQRVAEGEASLKAAAHLGDRVHVAAHEPQRYGTQLDERMIPSPIDDEAHIDERRDAIGLEPMSDYVKSVPEMYERP